MIAKVSSSPQATGLPIMLLTHPRACSTAFERVLMTRRDAVVCLNEPFADPSFFGPEACVERHHANGEKGPRPGFEGCTFKERMDLVEGENVPNEGKRAFVKDMAFQLSPWREREKLQIAKSLQHLQSDKDEGNPSESIPSLFRLSSTAAKREETGWQYFLPSEAGYYELRRMYDHLSRQGVIPSISPQSVDGERQQGAYPCLIDAEDLLRQPEKVVKAYCGCIGLDYRPGMLQWDSREDVDQATQVFATWTAFHRDAIESRGLKARKARPSRSKEEVFDSWVAEFGEQGAALIQKTIKENLPHYLYLKQFAIQIEDC
ncbi:hypothetical protein SCUP234_13003 [Seiridium cupressi]